MSIEQRRTVEVLAVEVLDDYTIGVTARDIFDGTEVVVSLTHGDAQQHVDEVLAAVSEAVDAISEDAAHTTPSSFDEIVQAANDAVRATALSSADILSAAGAQPVCADCREGKHGACIGSAYVLNGPDVDEVACACTADGHRGRS